MNDGSIKLLSRCFYFIDEGALLTMSARSEIYNQMWVMADPDSFKADNEAYIAYNEDSRDTRRMTDPQPEHLQFPLEI